MKKHQKNHFWNFALFTRFNLLIYLLVKFGRAKPTCLKKNKEGLWENAPSEKKAILKRQKFNMKRN